MHPLRDEQFSDLHGVQLMHPFTRFLAIVGVVIALLVVANLIFSPSPAEASGATAPAHVDRQNSVRVQ